MSLNISRLHYPVTALGPGRRAGIWVQGCSIGCAGCVSRDTWDHTGGQQHSVHDVLDWLTVVTTCDPGLEGITISGGEPSEQPDALHELLIGVHELRRHGFFDGDVLCYTGREEAEFRAACPWATTLVDALITGAFAIAEPTQLLWRGSANQQLIPLTARGRRRYEPYLDAETDHPALQLSVENGQVWMIGIPRRGDLRRLETALRRDGVQLEGVSWRQR